MVGFRRCVVEVVMNGYFTFSVVDIFCMGFSPFLGLSN